MKRILSTFALALFVPLLAAAQEAAPAAEQAATPAARLALQNRVFQTEHRSPEVLAASLKLLGSGVPGAAMSVNPELRTITVRDFPENIATIEDALARLDRPVANEPDIQFRVSILIASRSPVENASVPEDLAPVVAQLRSTLAYGHYGLMTTTLHRTRGGPIGVEGSGFAEPALFGADVSKQPIQYHYTLRGVNASGGAVGIENFEFGMQLPVQNEDGSRSMQPVGFRTPVSLRPGERVVIGTATMGDKALIVVVTATLG